MPLNIFLFDYFFIFVITSIFPVGIFLEKQGHSKSKMGKTKISWTEETWNNMTGCTPLSWGCNNCYARGNAARLHKNPNPKVAYKYRNGFEHTVHPQYLDAPLHWRKPRKIFVNSMSDTFHRDAPVEFIQEVFDTMRKCPQHIFQVLTKRAERLLELADRLPWPDNVWVGVTVENGDHVHRLDLLRQVPAKVRFVSFEPLLSAIPDIDFTDIHWAIAGGESGSNARPMDLPWARDIRDQCLKAKVPFFFKQVGGKGRFKGGKVLDGRCWVEFPKRELWQNFPPGSENLCKSLPPVSSGWMRSGSVSLRKKGASNVLVVVPHGFEGDDDNAEILGYHLAEALDAYGIVNNRQYRRPRTGTPRERSDPDKFIVDLNDPGDAKQVPRYWKTVFGYTKSILNRYRESSALVFFIHGMGDGHADQHGAGDICIGRGYVGAHNPETASGSEGFFSQFIQSLHDAEFGAVTYNVGRFCGATKMPPKLRQDLGGRVQAVQVEFRCTGFRDSEKNIGLTAGHLSDVIENLLAFQERRKEVMPVPTEGAPEVGLISKEKFAEKIEALRKTNKILDDKGNEISFEGDVKTVFISLLDDAYPVVDTMMKALWQTGQFLSEVRKKLKPHKLFLTWISHTGIAERTAYNYLRVYEKFGEQLPQLGHLGPKKLLIASRAKDCVKYVQENEQTIAQESAKDLYNKLRELRAKKQKKGAGRKPTYEAVGGFKVRLSKDGTRITIEGLTDKRQKEIMEGLKELLLQNKE